MCSFTSIEICAGAGGQALGLEQAGFKHIAVIDIDKNACDTLKHNRPGWNVIECDLKKFDGRPYHGIHLLAGGIPCPPFSIAGKQLGEADERNLFTEVLRLVAECNPQALMIENVRGILGKVFDNYRHFILSYLIRMGYTPFWRILNASDYGVPQLRPRAVLVAIRNDLSAWFHWPRPFQDDPPTAGQVLYKLMASKGWEGAARWSENADTIAPTLVGGSKKHGGPDLGPTRAKQSWSSLGVDGHGLANEPPNPGFTGMPRLTLEMVALLQGFPDDWIFRGNKTAAYRQIGNAFPPPVARAIGEQIIACLAANISIQVAI